MLRSTCRAFAPPSPGTRCTWSTTAAIGGSEGRPSEAGIKADALAVHAAVAARHTHIDVMGRSLGAGVATYLASERATGKLVLVTPFDSMVKVAKHYYWWLPVGLLLRDRYESDELAAKVTRPGAGRHRGQ